MNNQPVLEERCRQAVTELAHEQGWHMPPQGLAALTAAILPFVEAVADQSIPSIQRIALNYYQDGPMVQQMCTAGSHDGERLWADWRAYMVSLARGRGLSPEQAEELAQDVYLQTAKALPHFLFGSRLKTYFCGIFINCYRHWLRTAQRVEQREQALPVESEHDENHPLHQLTDGRPPPEVEVVERGLSAQLGNLVAAELQKILNSQDFQILYLYYGEGTFTNSAGQTHKWTDKIIGEQMGMPLNTVTARRLRALQRLKSNVQLRTKFALLIDGL
jgi:RNA polymerase sigma factor (sigma-70 family)